ncbi:hypothetical protein P8452_38099 [Trifolium repens]|nr:hypothetical protein P8452_38099 [Trifolium repens]
MKTSNSRAVLEHKQKFISPPSPLLAENQIQTPHRSNSPNTKLHVLDFFNNGTSKQSGIKLKLSKLNWGCLLVEEKQDLVNTNLVFGAVNSVLEPRNELGSYNEFVRRF